MTIRNCLSLILLIVDSGGVFFRRGLFVIDTTRIHATTRSTSTAAGHVDGWNHHVEQEAVVMVPTELDLIKKELGWLSSFLARETTTECVFARAAAANTTTTAGDDGDAENYLVAGYNSCGEYTNIISTGRKQRPLSASASLPHRSLSARSDAKGVSVQGIAVNNSSRLIHSNRNTITMAVVAPGAPLKN